MNGTGVFLSTDEYSEVVGLIQQTIRVNLKTSTNIYETNKRAAVARLQELASEKGLPPLGGGKAYGLSSGREFVRP